MAAFRAEGTAPDKRGMYGLNYGWTYAIDDKTKQRHRNRISL